MRFWRTLVLSGALALAGQAAASTRIADAAQPQLAAADGRVWLVYGRLGAMPAAGGEQLHHGTSPGEAMARPARPDGEIFVARSDDGGASLKPAVKVATVPGLMLGMRRGPRIAAHGDTLTVTLVGSELVAYVSGDAGQSWLGPVTINDVATSAREGLHDLAVAPDGRLFVTWLDLRKGKTALWSAESTDGGRTWSKNAEVYRSPDKSICECCHPSALFDAEGNLAVMWRNSIEGSRDLWMATRAKGASAFGAAKKLGEGTWKLNACPMDGGKIVARGGGEFGAVWMRAGEVFASQAGGGETKLGKGKQPVAVTQGKETAIFWQQEANLVSVGRPGEQPSLQAAEARFSSVVALPGGKGIVLAYEQGPSKERQPGVVVERR